MLGRGLQGLLGIELRPQHHRRGCRQAEHEMQEAPGMEERRGDHRRLPVAPGNLREQGRQGAEALRLAALCPLRGAGRAGREDDVAAVLGGRVEVIAVRARDQLLQRDLVGPLLLLPGNEAPQRAGAAGQQICELLVVDQGCRFLPLEHVGQLRAGEGGVQVERDGAELGAGHRRLDEVAVVAAHDRHAVPHLDALVPQGARQRIRAPVCPLPGERAGLVDDRDPLGYGDRIRRDAESR